MTYSISVPYNGASTLYAKPVSPGSTPSNSPWDGDAVTSGTPAYGAVPFTGLTDGQEYWIFERAGGSPANTDVAIAFVSDPSSMLTAEQAAKLALIGTGYAVVNSPVSADGDLVELIKDTDYLAANGRALIWAFDEITGITTSATGRFGITNTDDGAEVYVNTTGTVTEPTAGNFQVSFDIINTAISALTPGNYDWSVEVIEGSVKITIARNRQVRTQVEVVEKQT